MSTETTLKSNPPTLSKSEVKAPSELELVQKQLAEAQAQIAKLTPKVKGPITVTKLEAGKMEIGTIEVMLNELGSTVHRSGVTPAEAQYLYVQHKALCGKDPITLVEGSVEVVDRTSAQAVHILRQRYPRDRIAKLYAGVNPQTPQTFSEFFAWAESEQASEVAQHNAPVGPAGRNELLAAAKAAA